MIFGLGDWFSKKKPDDIKNKSIEDGKIMESMPVFDPVTGDIVGYKPVINDEKKKLDVFDVNMQAESIKERELEKDSRKDPKIEAEEKNRLEVCRTLNSLTWENKSDLAEYKDYTPDWDPEKMTSFQQKIKQVTDLSTKYDDLMNAITLLKGKNVISIGQNAKIEISNFIKETFGDFDFDWDYQENYNRDIGTSLRKKLGHDDKTINQAISNFRNFILSNNLADENSFNQYVRMFSINNGITDSSLNKTEYQGLMRKILKSVVESMEINFHAKADEINKIKNQQEMQEILTKFINEKSKKIIFRNPENQSMLNQAINDILRNSIYISKSQSQKIFKSAESLQGDLKEYYKDDLNHEQNPMVIQYDPDKPKSKQDR